MGGCIWAPKGCFRERYRSSKKSRKSKGGIKSPISSRKSDELPDKSSPLDCSRIKPTSQGSTEETWFDSVTIFESDGEDDFQNAQNGASTSTFLSPQYAKHEDHNDNVSSQNSVSEVAKKVNSFVSQSSDADLHSKSDVSSNDAKHHAFRDEISSHSFDENADGEETRALDYCSIRPNNCLPCLASTTVPSIDKGRSLSPGLPSMKKKTSLKLPFKWWEGHTNSSLQFSTKKVLSRPMAGSQFPFCPMEKKMFNCWSHIEPNTFKVRAENYIRDKKKDFASNYAAYYPVGVDVFLSQRKINHIARFVELPVINSSGKLPPILVVNVQVPLYPASIFQSENDGEGMSVVLYFRLSESYAEEIAPHFQENFRRVIDNEVEKVRGFPLDTISPIRERLKVLGRVANVNDLHMGAAERKLLHAYNEKPFLSRPQHEFYLEENYFEVDLDMHRFSYISRKGFEAFQDRLKFCIFDVGLTIQGNKTEELPEQILCCIRLSGIDPTNYHQLGLSQESL